MRRRTSGILIMTVVAAVVAAAIIESPASGHAADAPACVVGYQVDQWSNGFVGKVTVTNNAAPVDGWTLAWTFAGDQHVTSGWSADLAQSGKAVTARNQAFNRGIATGASVQFGFQATYQGSNDTPADFTLNGVRCNDTSPPTTTTTPPLPPAGCPSGAFCDGFENQTGTAPAGDWSLAFPNCRGTGTAIVDTSTARTGGKSIRVDGRAGYCNHVFLSTSRGTTGAGLYTRFYVRHTTALPESHVTFLAMKDTADGGKDLRMGGQNRALQWNRESDDATLPEQSPAGVAQSTPLAVNQWTCVEFGITGSELRTWVNGTEVPGLRADGVPTPDVDSQWLRRAGWRPALTNFRLGWESYGNGDDTLWFDDVVLAASRIGCS
ncbi:cellulose-binding protein [Lentzea aerocolonigenes]|uniref:Cellulose-binding protein n=1 Tax=Lentzea aerocolonigenes TaxID=68170 RepID=A0A0F0GE18_LENAE|nr:cellulose-binding domain-containing protein [Lentzea aerocolonigenes]KJK37910.1 cellulose-binding protein [Lentzea aerocolonigenes]